MNFYDLELCRWVRTPGSDQPPWTVPVLQIGGDYSFSVQFCRGAEIVDDGADTFVAGVKTADNFTGAYVASDTSPVTGGSGETIFTFDLTTTAAKAYFTTNPTAGDVDGVIQVAFEVGTETTITVPLTCQILNSYINPA